MEHLVRDTICSMITGAEKEVLVEVVKVIQKQQLNGNRGDWKEYLNTSDREFGNTSSDPSKSSLDVLAGFIKSFNQLKDLMFIGKIFRHFRDHKALEKYAKESLDQESPEQKLVRLTMEHPFYKKHYSFDTSYEDWELVPLGDISNAMKSNSMLSIDCEIVQCLDGTEEVVKVCIVDKKLKVKLERLVHPKKPVIDYRTKITGISAEDLEGVTCSLVDIQNFMQKLLKNGTILVGHSLHNDLRALKIGHQRVIDTSCIFKISDVGTTYKPSLNNLCKTVLGYAVRKDGEQHNCRNDAVAAMKLVLAKLEHKIDDFIKLDMSVPDSLHAMLQLHKIPIVIPYQELWKVFPQDCSFDIKADIKPQDKYYSTYAVFKDACEATDAFQRVEGQGKKDISGLPQKLVHVRLNTGNIVCFYIKHLFQLPPEASDSKRPRASSFSGEAYGRDPKVQRLCSSPESNKNAEEIARLKKELSAREDEIFSLQKILADLTGKP